MRRLVSSDIDTIPDTLTEYDIELESTTGLGLRGIGLKTADLPDGPSTLRRMSATRIAVVPSSVGLGQMAGFNETVAAILRHVGFDAFMTQESDVSGIALALTEKADMLFMADGRRFIALCPRERTFVDSDIATARGFVTGLSLMAGGIMGKGVLVIGCGRLGAAAAHFLAAESAEVTLIDPEGTRSRVLMDKLSKETSAPVFVADDMVAAVRTHPFILDAANAPNFIHEADLAPGACIASPGVPCAVGPRARKRLAGRLIHDPLQIGVAAMACLALRELRR